MVSTTLTFALAFACVQGVLAQIPGLNRPITAAQYGKIKQYTYYSGAAYGTDCPTPPDGSTIIKTWGAPTKGTVAKLFYSSQTNEIVLAFKGTSTPADFNTDFNFGLTAVTIPGAKCTGNCQVHQGFQTAYNTIANDVSASVKSAVAQYRGAALIVTGHSLGGALASLATASLGGQGLKFTTYTYGEPRNGNSDWSSYIDKIQTNYLRVTHFNDGVPNLPPTLLGFKHHGTEYWEKANTTNSASTTYNCGKGEPFACNLSTNPGSNPINGAHIQYSDVLVAASLYNAGCGYVEP